MGAVLIASTPVTVACPNCGSREVIYSCEPQCCFNHVCMGCRTSFQLRTVELPGDRVAVAAPDPEPPCDAPAAACAACGEVAVVESQGQVGCADCGARLALSLEDIDTSAAI